MSGNLRRLGFTGENLPDWHAEGSCKTSPGLDWYGETPDEIAAVKAVCAVCPVQVACLQWAIDRREAWGIWGGLDERERAEYAKKHGAEAPTIVSHGERSRYMGSKNVPGCRCDLCTRAHAEYEHKRRVEWVARGPNWKPPTKPCDGCGEQFAGRTPRQKFCTQECKANVERARVEAWRRELANRRAEKEARRAERLARRCARCDNNVPLNRHRYCSAECQQAADLERRQTRDVGRSQGMADRQDTAA